MTERLGGGMPTIQIEIRDAPQPVDIRSVQIIDLATGLPVLIEDDSRDLDEGWLDCGRGSAQRHSE